ncbi:hypothetical protein C8Q78DRAFT_1048136 [Trametes maxima]|nr:hypothetical protein C8Q78DRAFT_1048136 [Trametes maxima]
MSNVEHARRRDIRPNSIDNSKLVVARFKQVWKEYYEWEPEHCASLLSSLAVAKPSRPPGPKATGKLTNARNGQKTPQTVDLGVSRFTHINGIWDGGSMMCSETGTHTTPVVACSAYESCTPLSRNILHGDDSHFMPFLPYADDPDFDHQDHALEYKKLAWQEGYRGPDMSEIALETTRRLTFLHHLSVAEIDGAGILPLVLQTTTSWGAIWAQKQSDLILWPGHSGHECLLPDTSPPLAQGLRVRLQDYLTLWCPNQDCIQTNCFSHSTEQADLTVINHTYKAENAFCSLPVTDPCSRDCIMNYQNASESEAHFRWSMEELEELRIICHISCPATPCDLAKLCRKPCFEVAFICKRHDDFRIPIKRPRGRPRKAQIPRKFDIKPETAPEFVPNQPCNHLGPCGPDVGCACFLNKAHCSRNCRCSRACPRRWRGCRCSALPKTTSASEHVKIKDRRPCSTNHCSCWQAKRECDPAVCRVCCSSSSETDCCRNMQIQKSLHKRTEVKQGAFGLGLFLAEDAKRGDLVTEYIGELIYEPTFLCRGQVASHVNRSYVFGMNTLMSVDATPAGNPARFINHAPSKRANVAVSILLVNGDHRIGVFARKNISSGTELFMDYGPEYPIEGAAESESS